jgi:hypothetical protein
MLKSEKARRLKQSSAVITTPQVKKRLAVADWDYGSDGSEGDLQREPNDE